MSITLAKTGGLSWIEIARAKRAARNIGAARCTCAMQIVCDALFQSALVCQAQGKCLHEPDEQNTRCDARNDCGHHGRAIAAASGRRHLSDRCSLASTLLLRDCLPIHAKIIKTMSGISPCSATHKTRAMSVAQLRMACKGLMQANSTVATG